MVPANPLKSPLVATKVGTGFVDAGALRMGRRMIHDALIILGNCRKFASLESSLQI